MQTNEKSIIYLQVYRNLSTVTQSDLETVKRNFKWVADQLEYLVPPPSAHVIIFMGSASDAEHSKKIAKHAAALGLKAQLRVSSAHKGTEETLRILAEYEGSGEKVYKDRKVHDIHFLRYRLISPDSFRKLSGERRVIIRDAV